MRLTLRTMLAYLDDILEPADFRDLGKKIDESEFATGLVQRVRDVTRRLRLGAPKLIGKGMGHDANTVAEYLDNTLPADRVPEFEKICLESDVHLAEVGSCHQILTLVLGEPAEVDPESRRKMYAIVNRSESPAEAAAAAAIAAAIGGDSSEAPVVPTRLAMPPLPTPPPRPASARPKPVVPDYLREPRRGRMWTVAVTILIALGLAAAALRAMGPLDADHPVAKMIRGEEQGEVAKNDNPPADPAPGENRSDEESPDAQTPNGKSPNGAATTDNGGDANSTRPAGGLDPDATDPGSSKEPPTSDTPKPLDPGAVDRILDVDPARPVAPVPPRPDQELVNPADLSPDAGDPARGRLPALPDVKPEVDLAVPAAGAPDPAVRVGRFVSDTEVLLRFDAASSQWQRVPAKSTFEPGQRLLVLPTYKPAISLATGVTLQLLGETLIEFEPLDNEGAPGVRLHFGRMLVMTSGKPDIKVRVRLADHAGFIRFGEAETILAAEVRRYLSPGVDPVAKEAGQAIDLYATVGQATWNPAEGQPQQLRAPQRLTIVAQPDEVVEKTLPRWTGVDTPRGGDALAAPIITQALDDKAPVSQRLREQTESRRAEVRSLAARCLALIGEFDTFTALLNDADQRASWALHFDTLQAAMARGPEVARKVYLDFRKLRGEDGDLLYRMLWGFNRADLVEGGWANRLVDYLDHNNLDHRVLAYLNLKNITGLSFSYQPQNTPALRKVPIQRWRDVARQGQIVPKVAAARPATEAAAPARAAEPMTEPPAGPAIPGGAAAPAPAASAPAASPPAAPAPAARPVEPGAAARQVEPGAADPAAAGASGPAAREPAVGEPALPR